MTWIIMLWPGVPHDGVDPLANRDPTEARGQRIYCFP
jgi:hypothetical protein